MTNTEVTYYVIRYSGRDIPGLLHKVADVLSDGFSMNIDNVSMSSGAGLHTTFIVCHYDASAKDVSTANGKQHANSQRDLFEMNIHLSEVLIDHYKSYFKGKEHYEPADDIHITIRDLNSATVPDDRGKFQVIMSVQLRDEVAALPELTNILRWNFSLDNFYVTPETSNQKPTSETPVPILTRAEVRFTPLGKSEKPNFNSDDQKEKYKPIYDDLLKIVDEISSIIHVMPKNNGMYNTLPDDENILRNKTEEIFSYLDKKSVTHHIISGYLAININNPDNIYYIGVRPAPQPAPQSVVASEVSVESSAECQQK